jgi:hypothetical protein
VDVGFGYVTKEVVVDWRCIVGVVARMEALASVPAGEGSRCCTRALYALLALYLYVAF